MTALTAPRRVLVVTHNYPRFSGDPAGAFVARLAGATAERGHQVRVVAPHAPRSALETREGGVEVRRFRYGPDRLERVAYTGELHRRALRSGLTAVMLPAFGIAFRRAIGHAVSEFRPDVIHAHWWLPGGLLASGRGAPLVVTCHGSDVRLLERRVLRPLARRVFGRAVAVTTVSEFLARELREHFPDLASRMVVAAMPIDLEPWRVASRLTPRSPPVILYAGNLVPTKGVDTLLDAVASLERRGLPCQLRIVGEGPARPALMARAERLRLQSVEWSDFVDQEGMIREYGASTVVVLPSRDNAEGLGLVLVEALMAERAVVGSRAGGIPEVIEDRVTGRLVPDDDPTALAGALAEVLERPDHAARWIGEGHRRVTSRFATPNAVLPFLRLYERAAQLPDR